MDGRAHHESGVIGHLQASRLHRRRHPSIPTTRRYQLHGSLTSCGADQLRDDRLSARYLRLRLHTPPYSRPFNTGIDADGTGIRHRRRATQTPGGGDFHGDTRRRFSFGRRRTSLTFSRRTTRQRCRRPCVSAAPQIHVELTGGRRLATRRARLFRRYRHRPIYYRLRGLSLIHI